MFRQFFVALIIIFIGSAACATEYIGLSLPLSGRFSTIAEKMEFGAQLAIQELKSEGRDVELVLIDDRCDAQSIAQAVKRFREADVKIVVGPVCFKAAVELARMLNDEAMGKPPVPVVSAGTRNPQLERHRKSDKLPLFSLSNSPEAEAEAVVEKILPKFGHRRFAVVDDGSVYGRNLADNVRTAGENAGMKAAVSANFRPFQTTQKPLLKRLHQSGVEALFISAGPEEILAIASDVASLGYDWIIAAGESASLLPFTAPKNAIKNQFFMVKPTQPDLASAPSEIKKISDKEGVTDPDLFLGHALVKIAADTIDKKNPDLTGQSFDTVLGKLTFGPDGRAQPVPIALYRWNAGQFERQDERQP